MTASFVTGVQTVRQEVAAAAAITAVDARADAYPDVLVLPLAAPPVGTEAATPAVVMMVPPQTTETFQFRAEAGQYVALWLTPLAQGVGVPLSLTVLGGDGTPPVELSSSQAFMASQTLTHVQSAGYYLVEASHGGTEPIALNLFAFAR